jgi:hypothetical protein
VQTRNYKSRSLQCSSEISTSCTKFDPNAIGEPCNIDQMVAFIFLMNFLTAYELVTIRKLVRDGGSYSILRPSRVVDCMTIKQLRRELLS